MATIDQQFLEFIVKTLVNDPEKVKIERSVDERGVLLELTVSPEDTGRVIGRHGATAQAIRTLLRVLGTKNEARYNLKITSTEGEGEAAAEKPAAAEGAATDIESETEATEATEEAEESELAEKTRAELADLDDLDI